MFNVKTYCVSHNCVINILMFCVRASREFTSLEGDNPTLTSQKDEMVFLQDIFKWTDMSFKYKFTF